jgi:hypothetical protein
LRAAHLHGRRRGWRRRRRQRRVDGQVGNVCRQLVGSRHGGGGRDGGTLVADVPYEVELLVAERAHLEQRVLEV